MTLPELLAALNATLNATAGVLMCSALAAVWSGRRALHRKLMLAAVGASALFLASYLTRIAIAGDTPFGHEGTTLRTVYLAILASHVLLAMCALPLILRTVWLGLRDSHPTHRRWARWTWPVWLYVSVTGVVVYVMLYHVPGRA